MGITLGTNRKDVSMGYASFYRFRLEIAKAYSTDFYSKLNSYWLNVMRFSYIEPHVERLDKMMNAYIANNNIPDGLCSFIFQSDSEGKISCKTARLIRDLCLKSESEDHFGYHYCQLDMKGMAEIFDVAVKHRCNVKWY